MKILVFSDSHGMTSSMCDAVLLHKPDALIHLGDYTDDVRDLRLLFPDTPVYSVRGNGDSYAQEPLTMEVTLGGVRMFLTHGHTYRVKTDPSGLINTAMYAGVKLLLYGHTHIAAWDLFDDLFVINPGSIGYKGTYALLEAHDGDLRFSLKRVGEP